jgi:hypothetical protein
MNASLTSRRPRARKSTASASNIPAEFPTAPIAEIACGRFGTKGSDQVDRPMVPQSVTPRVSRREQHGDFSTGGRGRLCGEMVPVSVDLGGPLGISEISVDLHIISRI